MWFHGFLFAHKLLQADITLLGFCQVNLNEITISELLLLFENWIDHKSLHNVMTFIYT